MRCSEVKPGSYDCVYSIMPPYKCGMLDKIYRYVSIDKCLIHEIIHLWEQDIKTVGCCCGHGEVTKAYIQVQEECIPKMIELGYVEHFNINHPLANDCFIPKTVVAPTFLYGEIKKPNKVEEQETKNQKGE